jgi:hypothetical protein
MVFSPSKFLDQNFDSGIFHMKSGVHCQKSIFQGSKNQWVESKKIGGGNIHRDLVETVWGSRGQNK